MADEEWHILSGVIFGIVCWVFWSPLAAYAVALGNIFPDIDEIISKWHRSWLTHTPLVSSLLSYVAMIMPSTIPFLAVFIPFFTLGVVAHLVLDIIPSKRIKDADEALPLYPFVIGEKAPKWLALAIVTLPQIPFLLYGLSL
ncbi:MAG: hypothetical protein J7K68_04380 [Candidatus Diapherotrites archaeon]|nr:hypothetical protein [Candidatus Diapherotrites archaeon]